MRPLARVPVLAGAAVVPDLELGRAQDPIVRHNLLLGARGTDAAALGVVLAVLFLAHGVHGHGVDVVPVARVARGVDARAVAAGRGELAGALGALALAAGLAAKVLRQPGAQERAQGGRRGRDDGNVDFDGVEDDANVVVGVAGALGEVEEVDDVDEADDANDCDAGESAAVMLLGFIGESAEGPTLHRGERCLGRPSWPPWASAALERSKRAG